MARDLILHRVQKLADCIIQPADHASIQLTNEIRVRCSALVLLSHAEIEHAIEDACVELSRSVESAKLPASAMLAWSIAAHGRDGIDVKVLAKAVKAGGFVEKCAKDYRDLVEKNLGVKRSNLEALLLPIGVDIGALEMYVDVLDKFGSIRGEIAHKSPLKMQRQDAASAVKANVESAALAADEIVKTIDSLVVAVSKGGVVASQGRKALWTRIKCFFR